MKKIMFSFAIAGICVAGSSLVSAQTVSPVATTSAAEAAIPEPPQFASAEANKGIGEFVTLIREYAPAIKSNDMEALQAFGPKMQEWQQSANSWLTTLGEEDQGKLQSYMMEVGKAIQPSVPAVAPVEGSAPARPARSEGPR